MSDKCSYHGALDRQAVENHKMVAQRREQKSLEDYVNKAEKPVIEPGKAKRNKPHKKGSRAKSKR